MALCQCHEYFYRQLSTAGCEKEPKMKPVCQVLGYAIMLVLIFPLLAFPQGAGERQIELGSARERETPLEFLGLPKTDIAGLRLSARRSRIEQLPL